MGMPRALAARKTSDQCPEGSLKSQRKLLHDCLGRKEQSIQAHASQSTILLPSALASSCLSEVSLVYVDKENELEVTVFEDIEGAFPLEYHI